MKNKSYPLYTLPQITDLKDMLAQRAEATPDGIAFSYKEKDKTVYKTFKEFEDDVNALGTYIYSKGYRNAHIAVIGSNSYEWIVSFLAIANGGNVAVPIDKNLSAEKVEQLIRQSDCTAAFVAKKCLCLVKDIDNLDVYSTHDIYDFIYAGADMIADGNNDFLEHVIDPEKLGAIFFTSGTTGNSKGVMLSHKNMASDINSAVRNFEPSGGTLAVLPFHHTFGLITAVFMVIHYGYSTHINSSLKQLQNDLKTVKPQTFFVVPLFVETFYKSVLTSARKTGKAKLLERAAKISNPLLKAGIDIRKLVFQSVKEAFGGNLEYVICGGAALDPNLVEAFRTWGVEILNGYGITECSPVVSVNRNHYHCDGSVGQVLDGISVKIAEDDEILVKGDNVMMGYYKDEASTQLVLNDGWYSTGDLGRLDENGFLFITGRKKNLIILSNGENVSPEEIEAQILRDEAVAEAVVYEVKGSLAIQIFPEEEYLGNQSYFDELIKKYNKTQPQFMHIRTLTLRDEEFEKNSTKKILRFKVNADNHAQKNI